MRSDPRTQEAEVGGLFQFEVSLGHLANPALKQNKRQAKINKAPLEERKDKASGNNRPNKQGRSYFFNDSFHAVLKQVTACRIVRCTTLLFSRQNQGPEPVSGHEKHVRGA